MLRRVRFTKCPVISICDFSIFIPSKISPLVVNVFALVMLETVQRTRKASPGASARTTHAELAANDVVPCSTKSYGKPELSRTLRFARVSVVKPRPEATWLCGPMHSAMKDFPKYHTIGFTSLFPCYPNFTKYKIFRCFC